MKEGREKKKKKKKSKGKGHTSSPGRTLPLQRDSHISYFYYLCLLLMRFSQPCHSHFYYSIQVKESVKEEQNWERLDERSKRKDKKQ